MRKAEASTAKEQLQAFYWLKQDTAPSISAIAKATGKHRNTVLYSNDFRQKVIAAIEMDGRKKAEVSQMFNISSNTIDKTSRMSSVVLTALLS